MIMNKIFKNALVAFVAIMGLTMTSCVNKYEYSGATDEGSKVFFANDLASTVDVSFDDNKFQVAVGRTSTAGELTVPVNITMSEGSIFTPASNNVVFKDGEATGYLTFNYDPTQVEYGKYDNIKVEISDVALVSTYGLSVYAFKAGKTEWMKMDTSEGKATFRDDLIASLYGLDNYIFEVEVEKSVVTPNKYRVVSPYGPTSGFKKTKLFDSEDEWKECYNDAGLNVDMVIDASDPDHVWFSAFDSGITLNSSDGEMSFLSFIEYYMRAEGLTAKEACEKYPKYCGKLEDGVISFSTPKSCLATIGGEGYYYANGKGLLTIALPGSVIGDFSLTADYTGVFTDKQGQVFAVAEVKLGDDATNTKAVVMSADVDAGAVADAIAAGELEGIEVVDGANNVPIPEDLSGKLQIIFVVMNGKSVKTVVSVPFEYYGGEKSPWVSLGTDGVYYDDFVVPFATGYAYGPWPVQVEVEEHSETPGLYRVKAMYAGIAAAFGKTGGENEILIHAENPNTVYFLTQTTGLDLGNGEYSIVSYGGDDIEYFGEKGYSAEVVINAFPEDFGTLKDGVITLPILQRKDADGNPMYDDEGNPRIYQGYLYQGNDGYYACTNGGFQLILPGASPAAVAKAKRAAAAANFEYRLNGGAANMMKVSKKESLKRRLKLIEKFNPFK